MKHATWILLATLGSGVSLFAGDDKPMNGSICNEKCVVQVSDLPTCDRQCTDKAGDAVFVSDSGNVMRIDNQATATQRTSKRVKVKAVPTEKEREESLRIQELVEEAP